MKRMVLTITLAAGGLMSYAQKISFPDIFSTLERPINLVDTLMKQRGYELMQKEHDSSSILYYYTNIEKKDEAPTWVRSFTLMDANLGEYSSRLVSYRTYNSEEYRQLMAYLLANNYRTSKNFDFKESKHTLYSNGTHSVRVKITDNRLRNGKILKGYEFEVGK